MIYLLEKETGFGFHNAGNSAPDKFAGRSKKWRDWVMAHPNGKDPGVELYGASFVRNNQRGYALGKSPVASWKEEMKSQAGMIRAYPERLGGL